MAGETILIVEDRRENIVHLANYVLKPNGFQVITAMDGQRGLKRILEDRPDLVVLDLNIPKMDGLEVLKSLQAHQVKIPVILTTFYGSEQVAEQALHLGAADYVIKPYDINDMLAAIQKALAQHPPAPPRTQDKPSLRADEAMPEAMPLTRQVERWMRDMNILNRVGKALVSLLDLERVCIRTVEATIYVTRADHGFLYLVDPDDEGGLCLCATRGPRDQRAYLLERQAKGGMAFEVVRSGESMMQPQAPSDVLLFEIVGEPLGPMAAAPIRWRGKTIGALAAARSRGEAPFTETDVEWLSGLADYAAIAVHNARAFQERGATAAQPRLDEDTISNWQREVEQLGAALQAATETARRLAALLASANQDQA